MKMEKREQILGLTERVLRCLGRVCLSPKSLFLLGIAAATFKHGVKRNYV